MAVHAIQGVGGGGDNNVLKFFKILQQYIKI